MKQTSLLEQYLNCPDEPEEALLSELVFEVAEPVIRRVVRARLDRAPSHERDDVAGDVMASLVARLKAMKQEGAPPVERLESYVAVAAQNGCDQYLRRLYPQRHRARTGCAISFRIRRRWRSGKIRRAALFAVRRCGRRARR